MKRILLIAGSAFARAMSLAILVNAASDPEAIARGVSGGLSGAGAA